MSQTTTATDEARRSVKNRTDIAIFGNSHTDNDIGI